MRARVGMGIAIGWAKRSVAPMSPARKMPTSTGRVARPAGVYPFMLLTFAALLWAGNFVIGRAINGSIPPVSLAFWRWLIVLMILVPFGLPSLRDHIGVCLRDWRVLLTLGILGVGAYNTILYHALRHTTALNAALLLSITPMVIISLSWMFLRQRVTKTQVVGALVSFVGALTVISKGDPA